MRSQGPTRQPPAKIASPQASTAQGSSACDRRAWLKSVGRWALTSAVILSAGWLGSRRLRGTCQVAAAPCQECQLLIACRAPAAIAWRHAQTETAASGRRE